MTSRDQLDRLKRCARESEGLTKCAYSPDGTVRLECLYQRPMRYGRPERGAIEALCYRWEAVQYEGGEEVKRTAVNYEADVLSLLEGESLEHVQARREERDGGYADVAARNEARQLALAGITQGRMK